MNRAHTIINKKLIVLFVLLLTSFVSCKKDDSGEQKLSSIKIISTENEPKTVNLVTSSSGAVLAYTYCGDLITPPVKQELFILNKSGEIIRSFGLSDTLHQYLSAVPGLNGGFFVCGTSNTFPYIAIYHLNDDGNILWSKSFQVKFGTNKNRPAVTTSKDGNYMVMYQSIGSGYYIWKGDVSGNEIFNKKYPTPNAVHYGTGLNYGEKYVDFFQANDTLIITQGVTYDQYNELVENCFLRAVDENVGKKWYSDNYDSTHFELGAGLTLVNNKIILFGTRSMNSLSEYAGDVFIRRYELNGTFIGDEFIPRLGGTPNIVRRTISTPDGGYLLIGNNNQLPFNDLVSPTQIILIKLNADLTQSWTQIVRTGFPAKGFDAIFQNDGTIGLVGLMKDNYRENKLLYIHLDYNGRVINN